MSRPNGRASEPALGLVCITAADTVRYRTITRTALHKRPAAERAGVLRALYADNADRVARAVDFCAARGIRLYRVSSAAFPFSDAPEGRDVLEELADRLAAVGQRAAACGVRMVMHPDQFVVLSSDDPAVVANGVTMLTAQARVMDLLAQPRSAWATIEIHGGKGGRAARLVESLRALPDAVRTRIALENDERAYGAEEILAVCREARVPMVFDAHHHVCHDELDSYEHPSVGAMLDAARETWPDPSWQLVHVSNGREAFADSRHSDLITVMPSSYRRAPWIEVEAKSKEDAIDKLSREWLGTAVAA